MGSVQDMELGPLWLFVIEGLAIISIHDRASSPKDAFNGIRMLRNAT
jgi:hypothetical protein